MFLNTLLSQLLFSLLTLQPEVTVPHLDSGSIIQLNGNLMCLLDKTFSEGLVLQKEQRYGSFKDQQDLAASWVLRQQPHAVLQTPQIHHFYLRKKRGQVMGTLGNITMNVMSVPLLTAMRKTRFMSSHLSTAFKHLVRFSYGNGQHLIHGKIHTSHDQGHQAEDQIRKTHSNTQ